MGFHDLLRQQLASANVALAHTRLRDLRVEASWTPSHEPAAAHRQLRAGVSRPEPYDPRNLAKRGCGSVICLASVACGIRGVGGRTEGCVERVFLAADTGGVHKVRRRVQGPNPRAKIQCLVRGGVAFFRAGFDEQAHARDLAWRFAAAGFLATGPNGISDPQLQGSAGATA